MPILLPYRINFAFLSPRSPSSIIITNSTPISFVVFTSRAVHLTLSPPEEVGGCDGDTYILTNAEGTPTIEAGLQS